MTLKEAIKECDDRPRNMNLHWFVCEWNDGYIIHSSTYMKRFPDTKYVYSTGPFDQEWYVDYNHNTGKFLHKVKTNKHGHKHKKT